MTQKPLPYHQVHFVHQIPYQTSKAALLPILFPLDFAPSDPTLTQPSVEVEDAKLLDPEAVEGNYHALFLHELDLRPESTNISIRFSVEIQAQKANNLLHDPHLFVGPAG